jgi:hypothetical protein
MMITLNLISPNQRHLLRQRWAVDEVRSLAVSVLFVAAIASAATFSARYLLTTVQDLFTTNARATVAAAAVPDTDVAVAKLVRSGAAADVDWPSFLLRLSTTVPPHVAIASLAVNEDGSIQINGEAEARSDLLAFQQQLESSGIVQHLYSPVANLLQPSHVTFELSAELPSSTAAAAKP